MSSARQSTGSLPSVRTIDMEHTGAYPFPRQVSTESSVDTLRDDLICDSSADVSHHSGDTPRSGGLPAGPRLDEGDSRPGMWGRASAAFRASKQGEEGSAPTSPPTDHQPPQSERPAMLDRGSTLLHQGSIIIERSARTVWRELFLDIKNDGIAMAGEFVGTILFLVIALGAVQTVSGEILLSGKTREEQNTATRLLGNYYTASAFGFSLYATSSIFYRFTGSIFNPSVSLALMVVGVVRPVRFLLVSTAQMAGGICASFLLSALLPGPINIALTLPENVSPARALCIEAFATFLLVLNVLMLGTEKHLVTPHAPLGFGLTLFAIVLFAIEFSGAGINVARAFGASCLNGFHPYHWIYWLGPTIGALLATAFYAFLKIVKYWEINPGQDAIEPIHDKMGPIAPGAADNPVTAPSAAHPHTRR